MLAQLLLLASKSHGLDFFVVIVMFVDLAQSAIQSILAVFGHVSIDLGLVDIGRLQSLGNVGSVSSVVGWINLLILAPPLRIDHWVEACRTCPFSIDGHAVMWVVDLESFLRAAPGHTARRLFGAFAPPA